MSLCAKLLCHLVTGHHSHCGHARHNNVLVQSWIIDEKSPKWDDTGEIVLNIVGSLESTSQDGGQAGCHSRAIHFQQIALPPLPGLHKTVWVAQSSQPVWIIMRQRIKTKSVKATPASHSTISDVQHWFCKATSVGTKHESASRAPSWAKQLHDCVSKVLCWWIRHQMH